jgi:hypothetical protein
MRSEYGSRAPTTLARMVVPATHQYPAVCSPFGATRPLACIPVPGRAMMGCVGAERCTQARSTSPGANSAPRSRRSRPRNASSRRWAMAPAR